MKKVFVYGTLRKGEGNAELLQHATCIAEQCWTKGDLFDTGYGYPAMKQSESAYVYGELYSVTEAELHRLDQLEGFEAGNSSNLYERIERTVYTNTGKILAYVYVASNANLLKKRIDNGDWKEYQLRKRKDSVLYFAYGSCMDNQRFQQHGVDHYFQNMLGVGVLKNYTLRFTHRSKLDGMGRADIVEEGGSVEGKLYKIPIEALTYLYRREGAPNVYRPTFVTVELNGRSVQALTFSVKNKREETAPPDHYAEEIFRGADGYLSTDYISKIKNHIKSLKKLNIMTGGM
jgi:gamma-glutamylcyclotransferase (GGCT)/AIG2-like uncharacterized protein YtfP